MGVSKKLHSEDEQDRIIFD